MKFFKTTFLLVIFLSQISIKLFAFTDNRSDSLHILNYDISLGIRNLSSDSIYGETKITFIPKVNSIQFIRLDFLKLNISAISISGVPQSFSRNDSNIFISLNQVKNIGDTFILRIIYNGHPQTDSKWGGFYFSGTYAYNMGVGFVADPHSFGRCWFPCFDNFIERSTYDFHITTDSGYKAVCGGLLLSSIVNVDKSIVWHWRIATPIPTYLASVSVSNYEFINSVYPSVIQNKNIPIIIAAHAIDTQNVKNSFSNLPQTLGVFESKFGPYKFERVGYNIVPFSGGAMEHACNITYPHFAVDGTKNYENLYAHELSHHWWGDLATCKTEGDMWLNEGWAVYSEKLFFENIYGKQAYMDAVKSNHLNVLRYAHIIDGDFRAVAGIPHQYTYGEHVYHKGGDVIHTLRSYMGDSSFFAACHSHLNDFTFKDVTTNNRKISFQNATTADLNSFFNDWILNKGFCDFRIRSMETDSNYHTTVVIQQDLRAANGYYTNVPLSISFYDKKWSKVTKSFLMSGSNKTLFFDLGITPVLAIIDVDEAISFARSKSTAVIKANGFSQFPDALISLMVTSITDSALINVEHHWTSPDRGMCMVPGLYLSNYRYWKVDGIWPVNFKTIAYFYYDGTTPADFNGGYLDHTLIRNTEDSLFLVWRLNGESYWQIVPDSIAGKQIGNSAFDKTGRFLLKDLKKGEYAFAMYNKALAGIKGTEKDEDQLQMNIYPNPSKELLKIEINFSHQDGIINIINMQGKIVSQTSCSSMLNSIEIDLSSIQKGLYFVQFNDGTNNLTKKISIQ